MTSEPASAAASACLVLTTAASPEDAQRLAHSMVDARLAACVQLLPQMTSVYRWQGKVEQASEVLMLFKTTRQRLPQLEAKLHELHPYELPEFLVLDAAASPGFLAWIAQCVPPADEK